MDFDVRVALVILQADVVFGPVLFDQVHLKDKGLKLRPDHNPLDIGNLANQASRLGVVTGVRVKIGTDAILYADRFADINNFPLSIFHQVAARLCGKSRKDTLKFF